MAEMTVEQASEWEKNPSFRAVWETLQEVGRKHAEIAQRQAKTDEQLTRLEKNIEQVSNNVGSLNVSMAELKDTVREVTKNVDGLNVSMAELKDTVREVTKNVGGLNSSMGELIETLFAPHLGEKFDKYGYGLKRVFHRVEIYDDTNRLRSDIDILLSNTTVCMAVEVKRWLEEPKDVDWHIRRMQLIRQYPPAETKGKKLLGAIVGAVVTSEAREYAEQNGFFVLELTGEDVRLLEPPEGFLPKEW